MTCVTDSPTPQIHNLRGNTTTYFHNVPIMSGCTQYQDKRYLTKNKTTSDADEQRVHNFKMVIKHRKYTVRK